MFKSNFNFNFNFNFKSNFKSILSMPELNITSSTEFMSIASLINNNLSKLMMDNYMNKESQLTNYVSSPFSLLSALCMLMFGLDNESLEEIINALKLKNIDLNEIIIEWVELNNYINQTQTTFNQVLYLDQLEIKSEYEKLINTVGNLTNFNKFDTSNLVQTINNKINTITKGNIQNLLSNTDINSNTIIAIINAIHFEGQWKFNFELPNTTFNIFYGLNEQQNMSFMNMNDEYFRYFKSNTYHMIELDYLSSNNSKSDDLNSNNSELDNSILNYLRSNNLKSDYAFGIILPHNIKSLPIIPTFNELINNIDNSSFEMLKLSIPKFTFETEIDLIPMFKSMGINKIFDSADVNNMMTQSEQNIYISTIKQKAKITLTENGTTASAATVMTTMIESCMCVKQKKSIEFKANHPFSFYIRNKSTNTLIFNGIYC